jgi:hypothetical protein
VETYCWQLEVSPQQFQQQQPQQQQLLQQQLPQQELRHLQNAAAIALRQTSSDSESNGNDTCQAQLKPWPGSTVDAGPQNRNTRRFGAAMPSWMPEQQQTFTQMGGPGGHMQVFPEGTAAVSSMAGNDQLSSGANASNMNGDNDRRPFRQQLVPCMVLDPSLGMQQGNFMGFQMIQADAACYVPATNLAPAQMAPVAATNLAGPVAWGNLAREVYYN